MRSILFARHGSYYPYGPHAGELDGQGREQVSHLTGMLVSQLTDKSSVLILHSPVLRTEQSAALYVAGVEQGGYEVTCQAADWLILKEQCITCDLIDRICAFDAGFDVVVLVTHHPVLCAMKLELAALGAEAEMPSSHSFQTDEALLAHMELEKWSDFPAYKSLTWQSLRVDAQNVA